MEGSPVAVPATTKAAARAMTRTGACRFKNLMTAPEIACSRRTGENPVRHKSSRLAGVSDARNRQTYGKVLDFRCDLNKTCRVQVGTKLPVSSKFCGTVPPS